MHDALDFLLSCLGFADILLPLSWVAVFLAGWLTKRNIESRKALGGRFEVLKRLDDTADKKDSA